MNCADSTERPLKLPESVFHCVDIFHHYIMYERKNLMELMEEVLREKNFFNEKGFLGEYISKEDICVKVLSMAIRDKELKQPQGRLYFVAQSRAQHSLINYAMGLVFYRFANLFEEVGEMLIRGGLGEKR